MDSVYQLIDWSGIHLNVVKFKITAYIHALQIIPRKRSYVEALRSRLAHVTLYLGPHNRLPIPGRTPPWRLPGYISHSVPLPGGTPPLDKESTHSNR
jgi:hypothetical protein